MAAVYSVTNPRPLPPITVLRDLFVIDKSSPSGLAWVNYGTASSATRVAGSLKENRGYWWVKWRGVGYGVHRIIWALHSGADPAPLQVDHKDCNGANNVIANLRISSPLGNCRNVRARRNTSSPYKGVARHKDRWQAYIGHANLVHYLGRFRTAREAARIYNVAARATFGAFARLNDLCRPGETISVVDITTDEMWARVGLPRESRL